MIQKRSFYLRAALLMAWSALINAGMAASSAETMMRGNAKFNVVAVVLLIIFSGLAFFLIRLDKRVTKIEKRSEDKA